MAKLVAIRPRPAADKWLATVHTPKYVARIQKACREGAGYVDSRDTPVSRDSFKAAVHAAGGGTPRKLTEGSSDMYPDWSEPLRAAGISTKPAGAAK